LCRESPGRSAVGLCLLPPGAAPDSDFDDLGHFLRQSEFMQRRFGMGNSTSCISRFFSMMSRQARLTLRNPVLTNVRWIESIVLGLLYGAIFF